MAVTSFNLKLPRSWSELSDAQLSYFFKMKALGLNPIALQTFCLRRWAGFRSIRQVKESLWNVEIEQGKFIQLEDWQLSYCVHQLNWLNAEIPQEVVWLSQIKGHRAVHKYLQGVSFADYLAAEGYFQGYLHTKQEKHIQGLFTILFEKGEEIKIKPWMVLAVGSWWYSLKLYFATIYSDLFRSADSREQAPSHQFSDAINAQIRALTGGDITKEKEVLAIDTPRALVELNAKAREARELKKQMKR